MNKISTLSALWALGLVAAVACGDTQTPEEALGQIDFEPERPDPVDVADVDPYTGGNPVVLEAQARFPNSLALHQKVIARTCTPFDGVCHNSKEYPDLRTPGALLATIGAPCNVQPQEPSAVFGRCEPIGDRFRFDGADFREIEIGHVAFVPGDPEGADEGDEPVTDEDSPGLHLVLASPVPIEREEIYAGGQFIRTFIDDDGLVQDLVFFTFESRWRLLEGGQRLVAEVRPYQSDRVKELLSVGLRQGDLNRDGDFGGGVDQVPLIKPGDPEQSYLIARLRGHMLDEPVPGSLMPLANQPLSISEMLALFCFVEGLDGEGAVSPASPIDYAGCSYSVDPEGLNLLGEGVTWKGRISQILRANCGGCHVGDSPEAGLNLVDGDVYTRLLTAQSQQNPGLALIEPGAPEASYLWLKIAGEGGIEGEPMPIAIDGQGQLSEAQLADINTWLVNGAAND